MCILYYKHSFYKAYFYNLLIYKKISNNLNDDFDILYVLNDGGNVKDYQNLAPPEKGTQK